ncbi:relaxase/mobilization nuclease domain-containing protein [Amycolatopsis tolypomycina]|uniref:relaxase/mobilization nuclease domain-containing protein n=1 Tax=Amycolatopsis tolypomycina TaxID=208445 RepID=UPI0033AFA8CD
MIDKVVYGYRPAGLIHYLFGPGKFEQHHDPRVVATWDGAPWLHQPDKLPPVELDGEIVEPGEFDFDLRQLVATMQQWPVAAGLPLTNPPRITPEWEAHLRSGAPTPRDAPAWLKYYKYDPKRDAVVLRPGYVWHCPLRLHPDDPILSDEQWAAIAKRMMTAAGIHQAGCRWIAVRHDDAGIHLVATLVSERSGKRFHPYRDWTRMRSEAQKIERELGLVATAGPDKTALRAPSQREHRKAARLGRTETARSELRRAVAQAAAASHNGDQFLHELRQEGLNPVTRIASTGQVCGYNVALPGDVNAAGEPVFYSGSALATDLSWPKLEARWASTPLAETAEHAADGRMTPALRRERLQQVTAAVDRAAAGVRAGTDDAAGVAHATGEILYALSRGLDGRDRGTLADIAECYDRAARTPHRVLPRRFGAAARELRRASRQITALGALTGRGSEKFAVLALLLALGGLVAEIAAWRQQAAQHHQAVAADSAARALATTSWSSSRSARRAAVRPPTAQPSGGANLARRRTLGPGDARRPHPRPRGTAPG